jgi:hypothetical protein
VYSGNTATVWEPTTRSRTRRLWFSKFPAIHTAPWKNMNTGSVPVAASGRTTYNVMSRPSTVIMRSSIATPERSTGVLPWSAVTIVRGSSPGSSQKGLLSLLSSRRNARVRRSMAGS